MKKHGKKQKNKSKFDNVSNIVFHSKDDLNINIDTWGIADRMLTDAIENTKRFIKHQEENKNKVQEYWDKKEKSANDIEASIPVSEFAEYCRALGENRYSNAFDIRNGKGDNWIKEMFDKLENNNEEFRKLYQGTWIDECTPITKSNFEKLMSIKKPKTKEMKKEIIGYKFKNESAHNKFLVLLSILSDIVFVDKYIAKGFYLKGFDINNQDYNLLFKFAKKYNLLDELFTPVYKEESNYKTELNKALDSIDKVRKALEKIDSAIKKIKSND